MITGFLEWLRDSDDIVNPFYTSLHGGDDTNKRTVFGGILSLSV